MSIPMVDTDGRSYGNNIGSGVGDESHMTQKYVIDITLKVVGNEDSIELGKPLRVMRWGWQSKF